MICFRCPRCEKTLKVPDKKAGKALVCPRCEESIVVPAESLGTGTERRHSGPEEEGRAGALGHADEALSLLATMSPRLRWIAGLVLGVGLLSLVLPVLTSLVPGLAGAGDAARSGAMLLVPASLAALLAILHGHGTSCPACARWWARRKGETEFVDKEVFEKDGTPFGRTTLRTHYACESCGHHWSVIRTEEYKEPIRERPRSRLG